MQIIRMSMKNTLLIISCVLINEIESNIENIVKQFSKTIKISSIFYERKKSRKKKIVQVFNLDNLIGNFV